MAITPQVRVNADGTKTFRINFRIPPSRTATSETFDTIEDALGFAALIDKVGPAAARKIRIAATLGGPKPLITGQEAFEEYQTHVASYAEEGTVQKYRRQWDLYLKSTFGGWPVDQIPRKVIEDWITAMRKRETIPSQRAREKAKREGRTLPPKDFLSAKTIANAQGLLSSVLQLQVERGRTPKNEAKGVTLPDKRQKRKPVFLSRTRRDQLMGGVEAALGHRRDAGKWLLLIDFELSTGLRFGEISALLPGDFDLDSVPPKVTVSRAWKYRAEAWGTTKSTAGDRIVSFPDRFVEPLRDHMSGLSGDGLVFAGPRGGRLRDSYFHRYIWQPSVKASGLDPAPRFHDLRHTHVSMLIQQGVPLPYVQQRIGHEDISTTVQVYGHLSEAAHAVTAQATDAATRGPQVPEPVEASAPVLSGSMLAAMRETMGEDAGTFAARLGADPMQLAFLEATDAPLPDPIVQALGEAIGATKRGVTA